MIQMAFILYQELYNLSLKLAMLNKTGFKVYKHRKVGDRAIYELVRELFDRHLLPTGSGSPNRRWRETSVKSSALVRPGARAPKSRSQKRAKLTDYVNCKTLFNENSSSKDVSSSVPKIF